MIRYPDFWVEIVYRDGYRASIPFFGIRDEGEAQIRQLIAADRVPLIDFVVLISGDWVPGTIARSDQILADAQSYYVQGAKRCK